MSLSTTLIKTANHIFPKVVHPFNLNNDGKKTYARWQYEKGYETIRLYMKKFSTEEMFLGKRVLDMGCGAAGKSLYYASLGALKVTGVDAVSHYEGEAKALADELSLSDRFEFVCGDATRLPFSEGSFDTIIMNDFMEHVSDPEGALRESFRLVAQGGRIFINFPPYHHPFGAHLSDAINMPWVHLFFSERALVLAYKDLVKGLPDEAERLSLRFSKDSSGRERIGYINRMTLKRFKGLLQQMGIKTLYYEEVPLREMLKPLASLPVLKEMFVKMAVCVIQK